MQVENNLFDDMVDNVVDDTVDQNVDVDTPSAEPVENPTDESTQYNDTDDVFTAFLKSKGLKDGKTVLYETENGNEEVDFHTLDRDEQMNILNELNKPNLSDEEIATIEYLRDNRLTLNGLIQRHVDAALQNYISQNGPVEKRYSVDDYSDDELYVADLTSKFEMSDEEIESDLEMAKSNPELFQKKVEAIRKTYKNQEDKEIEDQRLAQEAQYKQFADNITDALHQFNDMSLDYTDSAADSLQIEDSEKEQVYNYILKTDENGATQFFKDLNDPRVLVELAWYRLYGKDAISGISQYWKSVLKESRKSQTPTKKTQTTVIPTREDPKKTSDRTINSIWSEE